ncbi:MAG TPA: glutamate 5-kinase [Phycisphaeraceae bacterium]
MPSTALRKTVLTAARRIVVKIGTQLLTSPQPGKPGLDLRCLRDIARQIAELCQRGYEVTLVSSGAIGAGCAELGLPKRPTDVADQQAVAAVGQRGLMMHMHDAFARHGLHVGQMLLTRSDFDDRVRFLNIRNCVTRLHRLHCIPIVNENDTVAVDEIRFGDNDMLSALMCNALRADALILLTTVDGLLDAQGQVVDWVESVTDCLSLARRETSRWGTGGILSKLEAARIVTEAGETAVIACGREKDVLHRLLSGEKLGTVFAPAQRKLDSRQRWIGLTARPAGTVTIDDGAVAALCQRGKSLLASGIQALTGQFERGEVLLVRDPRGREVARGLTNYSADELRLIMGKRSNQFEKILGRPAYAEVIHRDNLVVLNNHHNPPPQPQS